MYLKNTDKTYTFRAKAMRRKVNNVDWQNNCAFIQAVMWKKTQSDGL